MWTAIVPTTGASGHQKAPDDTVPQRMWGVIDVLATDFRVVTGRDRTYNPYQIGPPQDWPFSTSSALIIRDPDFAAAAATRGKHGSLIEDRRRPVDHAVAT
jgi:hypothetical protein